MKITETETLYSKKGAATSKRARHRAPAEDFDPHTLLIGATRYYTGG